VLGAVGRHRWRAWDSKYEYGRKRPSEVDDKLMTALPNPRSPAYPAEHAVAAGAAGEVLSYIFPDRASAFAAKGEEAGRSRVLADPAFEFGRPPYRAKLLIPEVQPRAAHPHILRNLRRGEKCRCDL